MPFGQAMRLLAGAEIDGGAVAEPTARWAHVQAGPWLAAALEACRSPDGLAKVNPGEALQATLRPYQETGLRWLYLLNQLGLLRSQGESPRPPRFSDRRRPCRDHLRRRVDHRIRRMDQ